MRLNCDTLTARYYDHSCCHMHRMTIGSLRKTAVSYYCCGRRIDGLLWNKRQDSVDGTDGIQKGAKKKNVVHIMFSRDVYL